MLLCGDWFYTAALHNFKVVNGKPPWSKWTSSVELFTVSEVTLIKIGTEHLSYTVLIKLL